MQEKPQKTHPKCAFRIIYSHGRSEVPKCLRLYIYAISELRSKIT